MMNKRENKFRVWDKLNKRWVQCPYPITSGVQGETTIIGVEGDNDEDLFVPNDIEFLWYTGLKDKQGVEIYEGDIVSEGGGSCVGVVYYDEGYARFQYISKGTIGLYGFYGEVIGNVYEHPELLEVNGG